MEVKDKWWVISVDNKEQLFSYRNSHKLITYLKKKIYPKSDIKLIREGTKEDYYNFHNLIDDIIRI